VVGGVIFADSNNKTKLHISYSFLSTTLGVETQVLKSASHFAFFDTLSLLGRKSFKGHVSTFQALKLNSHQTAKKIRLL
jgi:hypothetical protein